MIWNKRFQEQIAAMPIRFPVGSMICVTVSVAGLTVGEVYRVKGYSEHMPAVRIITKDGQPVSLLAHEIELVKSASDAEGKVSQNTILYHATWSANDPGRQNAPPPTSWDDNELEISLKGGVLRIRAIIQDDKYRESKPGALQKAPPVCESCKLLPRVEGFKVCAECLCEGLGENKKEDSAP